MESIFRVTPTEIRVLLCQKRFGVRLTCPIESPIDLATYFSGYRRDAFFQEKMTIDEIFIFFIFFSTF